jgi:hypothetical protein
MSAQHFCGLKACSEPCGAGRTGQRPEAGFRHRLHRDSAEGIGPGLRVPGAKDSAWWWESHFKEQRAEVEHGMRDARAGAKPPLLVLDKTKGQQHADSRA